MSGNMATNLMQISHDSYSRSDFLTELNSADHNESALFFYYELMKTSLKHLFFLFLLLTSPLIMANNLEEGNRLFDAGQYKEAITFLTKPDVRTDPGAMNLVAYMYNHGLGIQKNPEIAFEMYKKAANAGLPVAQFNVGLFFEKGKVVSLNQTEAIKWFRKAAEQNYPPAQAKMGYLTVMGRGVKKDYSRALKWYQQAAEHGEIGAYSHIGLFYDKGLGIKKDPNRAVQYYILGAEKGDSEAQLFLADCYAKASGIPYDAHRALYWYKESAKNGNITAMKVLSGIYKLGQLGVQKNPEKSRHWLEMAKQKEALP